MRGFFAEIRKELTERVGRFYPHTDRFDNIWVKWIECPRCGLKVPTRPNWWLLKRDKLEESYVILPDVPEDGDEVEFDVVKYSEVKDEFDPKKGTKKGRGGNVTVTCPRCGTTVRREQVHRLFRRHFEGEHGFVRAYLAAVVEGSGRERKYRAATDRDLEFFERAREELFERWDELIAEDLIPTEEIPEGEKTREPRLRGINRFYKLFSERQLLVHAELLRVIRELSGGLDDEYREPLTVYAMIAFDKLVDYNNIFCQWEYSSGVVKHIFRGHAYAWSWDHGEMNVLAEDGGWYWAAPSVLEAYEEIAEWLKGSARPEVVLDDARNLPDYLKRLGVKSVDAIVVDPPYYDNIQYAELADFFYVWLKRLFGHPTFLVTISRSSPESATEFQRAFSNELTPKDEEIVANRTRHDDPDREYERGLREFLEACREVLPEHGRLTLMFTHKATEAWTSLVRALRDAGFEITEVWPVRTEMERSLHQRWKAAVGTTQIIACRPRSGSKVTTWRRVREEVRRNVREAFRRAADLVFSDAERLVVARGAALRPYTRYDKVLRSKGDEEVEVSPEEVMEEAYRAVPEAIADQFEETIGETPGFEDLDEAGRFYFLYRFFWEYPKGPKEAPDYEDVLMLAHATDFPLNKYEYRRRTDAKGKLVRVSTREGRTVAILDDFESREPGRVNNQVDALHAVLTALTREGDELDMRTALEVAFEHEELFEPIARALARLREYRLKEVEDKRKLDERYPELKYAALVLKKMREVKQRRRLMGG
jgi:putative DNA methylase